MDLASRAASVGALADPTRRALYEYVVGRAEPVGRDEAARALDLAAHSAKFHLDRLVAAGLLSTEFRRLSGRTGPGAGRPSKLYRRADAEVRVSLPDRRYDLVGEILAAGVERATTGVPLDDAVAEAASQTGRQIGTGAGRGDVGAFTRVLGALGFEPRAEGDLEGDADGGAGTGTVLLANCPFDALARTHTALVCGINRAFVQGVADGMGCTGVTACLEPEPGRCCVKARVSRSP